MALNFINYNDCSKLTPLDLLQISKKEVGFRCTPGSGCSKEGNPNFINKKFPPSPYLGPGACKRCLDDCGGQHQKYPPCEHVFAGAPCTVVKYGPNNEPIYKHIIKGHDDGGDVHPDHTDPHSGNGGHHPDHPAHPDNRYDYGEDDGSTSHKVVHETEYVMVGVAGLLILVVVIWFMSDHFKRR